MVVVVVAGVVVPKGRLHLRYSWMYDKPICEGVSAEVKISRDMPFEST